MALRIPIASSSDRPSSEKVEWTPIPCAVSADTLGWTDDGYSDRGDKCVGETHPPFLDLVAPTFGPNQGTDTCPESHPLEQLVKHQRCGSAPLHEFQEEPTGKRGGKPVDLRSERDTAAD